MNPVNIIGVGLCKDHLTKTHHQLINDADIVIGGKRHLDQHRKTHAEKIAITKDILSIVALIKKEMQTQKIVVLATGDPLFYGIGSTLIKHLGPEHIKIHTNVSSIAYAFAAIKEPWQDAVLISFHGRQTDDFKNRLTGSSLAALLTDTTHTPAWIAKQLISMPGMTFKLCVLENLGNSNEKITWFDHLEQVVSQSFSQPNLVIIKQNETIQEALKITSQTFNQEQHNQNHLMKSEGRLQKPILSPGMPEHMFHHDKGLITKAEIRAISLSKLRITSPDQTLWDLGSGSGSVAIEASRFLPNGLVIAVEKNPERIRIIKKNSEKFKVSNLSIIHQQLPEGINLLPKPDRIFIGGGGRDLLKIIEASIPCLKPGGIIVVNTVLLEHLPTVETLLHTNGFITEIIHVQVSRSKAMPFGHRMEALNPVWIFSGEKPGI